MKKYCYFFAGIWISLGLIIISSCSKDENEPNADSGKIKTESSVLVIKKSIPANGGELSISGTQTPLEGLRIIVPDGAYSEAKDFSVSYSKISSHSLGQYFNPVSPLIEITNGGKYSDKMMKLQIPVTPNAGFYRMAYYYDKKSGLLEGIPAVSIGDHFIEIAVRHFSLIVVTEVQKDLLIQGGGFHTLFAPQVNGWSFRNFGTYPAPDGICAGMSIGAAYYFKNFNSSVNLFSYFENDKLWFRTTDFWEDDVKGLQFATAIHRVQEIFWSSNNQSITEMLDAPQDDRFWNLIYSMLVNNQPQLIYVKDSRKDTAHMIIGFSYEINASNAKIHVYDPNYPGLENVIEYDLINKTFKPYTSAANAKAIEDGDLFQCDKIALVPLSSVMTDDEMNFFWQKVQNNTIGDGIFPPYKVYAVPKDPSFTKVELNVSDNSIVNYIPFDEFDFEVNGIDPSYNLKLEMTSFLPGFGQERINPATTVKMTNKDTLMGLYLKAIPPGGKYEKWIGFDWFKIQLSDIWIEPADTSVGLNVEVKFVARHNGSAPKRARFDWDFGDPASPSSENKVSTTDTFIIHKYKNPGTFEITLSVIDLDNQKEVAKVTTKATATIWPKIAITLKGMDTNPPSTIKASDGSDIPSIAWSNKYTGTAPALSWNKNTFDADFQFNLFPATYTCTIHGTLSDDGKKITSLSAIYTGIAYGGDWTYQAAIVLQNFPLEDYLPGQIIGKTLTGRDAQSKVAQLSWKQTSKDSQGIPHEITLKSVDWNSNQTELSVFFYDR
jgi:hypothetical protein